ncbi:P-loop containing nucleoside triphosphate hydrolases superfamily protein [Perilla frutescens var. frutescens]|nr:P-loop containing nucleoside triphosphate hydrolases superfamily protein [Perilla frutescens var. frutescens]
MNELFTNVVCIKPPKDQDLLNTFVKQIEEDRLTVISEGNLSKLHKVLKDHNLSCMDLELANVEDMILTKQKAEKIVGWATNHYISSCPLPRVYGEILHIQYERTISLFELTAVNYQMQHQTCNFEVKGG